MLDVLFIIAIYFINSVETFSFRNARTSHHIRHVYSDILNYNNDRSNASNCRIGFGYDIHRLSHTGDGNVIKLGGIVIPDDDFRTISHSDGDVVYHSIADAILGALGKGDIGDYFPDDDPSNKGLDSLEIVNHTLGLAIDAGFSLVNVDVCIILQYPKLGPALKRKIADNLKLVLGFDTNINVKAKTNEGLDSIGNKNAVACHTVALLQYNHG